MTERKTFVKSLVLTTTLAIVLMVTIVSPVFARNKDADVPVMGLSAGFIAICPPFGGGFQVGYWGSCLIFGDPPDTANACISVDLNDFLIYQFPDVLTLNPAIDPGLAAIMDAAVDDMDRIVALSRALKAARDRYEGALLLGKQSCADDRYSEMISFNKQLYVAGKQSHISLDAYIHAQNLIDPSVLNVKVTKQEVKNVRDQIALGSFPAVDDAAIRAWALTPLELQFIQDAAAAIPYADIDSQFALWDPVSGDTVSMGFLLDWIGDNVAEKRCCDPTICISCDGGIAVPVDKFGLLTPYIGAASTIIGAMVATAVYVKHRKEKQ